MDNASAMPSSSGSNLPVACTAAKPDSLSAAVAAAIACHSAVTSGGAAPDQRAKIGNPALLTAMAAPLVERFTDGPRTLGLPVATGSFGAETHVELVNDGPVTIWLDTADW